MFEVFKNRPSLIKALNHEFRTPLNGIMGMLELLQNHDLDDEVKDLVNTAIHSAEQLNLQINSAIDLCRLDTGIFKAELESILPQDLLNQITNRFVEECQIRGVEFGVITQGRMDVKYELDHTRCVQVLAAVISAVLKYSTIKAIDVKLSISADHQLLWSIKDQGRGLPVEVAPWIFEIFQREESDLIQRYAGLGLGLTQAKIIWESMGGTFVFTNQPDEGCLFELSGLGVLSSSPSL